MLTIYLLIGLAIQLLTTTERIIRKVTGLNKEIINNPIAIIIFMISYTICCMVNIILWPVSIIFECINIMNKK